LIVLGDFGDAVYSWSQKVSLEFLADCDLDYFHSKCVSVPRIVLDNNFMFWDSSIALNKLKDLKKDFPLSFLKEMEMNLGTSETWEKYLSTEFYTYFSYYEIDPELIYNVGNVIHPWCEKHLQALKDVWSIVKRDNENINQANPTNVVYFGGR
jgi:hypothetical protein